MTQPKAPFDANQVDIHFAFKPNHVGLILRGLSELPMKEVGQLHDAIRTVAVQTIQAAEAAAQAEADKQEAAAAEPTVEPAAE